MRVKKLGAQVKTTGNGRIGCDIAIYEEIAEIANDCGLTMTSVINALLNYALAHSEIVEETQIVKRFMIGTSEELDNDSND